MTKKEFIEALAQFPDDMPVFIQDHEERNVLLHAEVSQKSVVKLRRTGETILSDGPMDNTFPVIVID